METPRFIDIYRRFSYEIHEDFYFFWGVSQLAMFDDTGYKKRQFFIRLVGSAPIGSAQGAPGLWAHCWGAENLKFAEAMAH